MIKLKCFWTILLSARSRDDNVYARILMMWFFMESFAEFRRLIKDITSRFEYTGFDY